MSKLTKFQRKHLKINFVMCFLSTLGISLAFVWFPKHPTMVLVYLVLVAFQLGSMGMLFMVATDVLDRREKKEAAQQNAEGGEG
jgi:hypothetical protein